MLGIYQNEKKCKKNPNNDEHCWHQENVMYTTFPPKTSKLCCWCSETIIEQHFPDNAKQHGRFLS